MSIKRPEGTQDLIGESAREWAFFESCAMRAFEKAGYEKIELPLFEKEELFVRGIGESTDVVNKEMFSVLSGGNLAKLTAGEKVPSKSRFALRPEGTAGVVRAAIENKLLEASDQPARLWYAGEMFRAERPQKGRQRQFMQVGLECLGGDDPLLDAQAISLMLELFCNFGIDVSKCKLHINSMGCKNCRPAYRDAVERFLAQHSEELCETCNARASLNPLRAFDCKNEDCKQVMQSAPRIDDYLCEDCKAHFDEVKALLEAAGITFEIDTTLVRGLDYYTRTVFECTFDDGLGAQNAIGGGGRYDGLVAELGGKEVPGMGFAVGFERCLLAKGISGATKTEHRGRDGIFIAALCEEAKNLADTLLIKNQFSPLRVDMDFRASDAHANCKKFHSLKSQLRLSDKLNVAAVLILGEDELSERRAKVKFLETHEEAELDFDVLENKEKLKEFFKVRGLL